MQAVDVNELCGECFTAGRYLCGHTKLLHHGIDKKYFRYTWHNWGKDR